jgi:hypothetical protein
MGLGSISTLSRHRHGENPKIGVPDHTIEDEGKSSAYLLGSEFGPIAQKFGINWRHNFPGIHRNGSVDWW